MLKWPLASPLPLTVVNWPAFSTSASMFDKAIRDGKFSAASRPVWVRQWDADPEATRDTLATLKRNVVPVEDIGSGGGSLDDEAFEEEFKGLYPPGTFDRKGR